MRQIPDDLTARVISPPMPELEKIGDSINDLAADLDANLSRQKELEQSLIRNEKLAALGRVVAGVAHEVRNPLASMKLKIQLAERSKSDADKLEKTFNVLREEIDRLDSLVKKLLEVSRPAKLNLSRILLPELIEQRHLLFSEKAAGQNVRIDFQTMAEKAEIVADRERLTQVFDNLFNNALEAMPNGGNLEISLEEEAGNYRIKFADDGKGFTETEREQLFEPFFTTKDHGTGLGLTISREIVEAHGGSLFLENTGSGAVFVVELPHRAGEQV
jgi:signal transduction histidine kinase